MTRDELQCRIEDVVQSRDQTADIMKILDGYMENLPQDEFCRTYKLEHGSVCRYHCKFFDWSTGSCKWTDKQSKQKININ